MDEFQVLSFMLVLSRVSAFIGFFPLFGQHQLPVMVKAGLATALTAFWYGTIPVSPYVGQEISTLLAVLLIAQEVGIGLLLAMMLGFLLLPARIAGSYIGQEIGISMEPVTNSGSEQSTMMASIFESFAILLFFGLNLHHFIILFLHLSMNQLANKINLMDLPTEGLVNLVDQLPEYGLLILAPMGVLSFVMVIGLFFLSKAAPTMNLFSVGMPLRVGLGLFCLTIFIPVLIRSMVMYFHQMLAELEQFMGYFE